MRLRATGSARPLFLEKHEEQKRVFMSLRVPLRSGLRQRGAVLRTGCDSPATRGPLQPLVYRM
jgi:hypothetical protein